MKKPVPSQIKNARPNTTPPPMPAVFISGGIPPFPGPLEPGPLLPPPNKPLSFRLKSRHNTSRSGGPDGCPALRPSGAGGGLGASCAGDDSSVLGFSDPFSSERPHRLSFRLNMPSLKNFIICLLLNGVPLSTIKTRPHCFQGH